MAAGLVAGVALVVSCAPYVPSGHRPMLLAVPAKFAERAEDAADRERPGPDRWWEAFGDDRLTALIQRALSDNFDIRTAWARLVGAQAVARIEGARLSPQVSVDAGISKERLETKRPRPDPSPEPALPAGLSPGMAALVAATRPEPEPVHRHRTTRTKRRSLVPAATYELDLWGRLHSLEAAAKLDVAATRGDVDAVAMTLAANVAATYFQIVEQRARLDVIRQQIELNETYLDLTRMRFGQGQASAVDVYQQRQQLASAKANQPLAEGRLKVLEHQLAVLAGQPPGAERGGDLATLPDPPPAPATGVPAALLQRRPDIRAAELSIAAADQRLAAAIADQFPTLRLTGQLPFRWTNAGDLVKDAGWSIAGSLSQPLVDGGRREAEVVRQKALFTQRVHAYASVVLTALREVEDALVQERQRRAFLARVQEQLGIARLTLREARARYVGGGGGDYLPVLTALRDVQRLELLELSEKQQVLGFRIRLYRALGGSWMGDLAPAHELIDPTKRKSKPTTRPAPGT